MFFNFLLIFLIKIVIDILGVIVVKIILIVLGVERMIKIIVKIFC